MISHFAMGLLIAYVFFVASFSLFGDPEKEAIQTYGDSERRRKATVFKHGGNAVTLPSILVSVGSGCADNSDSAIGQIVFAQYASGAMVEAEWRPPDTLTIFHSEGLALIIQADEVLLKN